MAILFKSPKKEKRILFWGISSFVIFLLIVISVFAFPYQFSNQDQVISDEFSVPKMEINFDILNSPKIKSLEQFVIDSPKNEDAGRQEPFLPYYQ